jgi:hypothetical protein
MLENTSVRGGSRGRQFTAVRGRQRVKYNQMLIAVHARWRFGAGRSVLTMHAQCMQPLARVSPPPKPRAGTQPVFSTRAPAHRWVWLRSRREGPSRARAYPAETDDRAGASPLTGNIAAAALCAANTKSQAPSRTSGMYMVRFSVRDTAFSSRSARLSIISLPRIACLFFGSLPSSTHMTNRATPMSANQPQPSIFSDMPTDR